MLSENNTFTLLSNTFANRCADDESVRALIVNPICPHQINACRSSYFLYHQLDSSPQREIKCDFTSHFFIIHVFLFDLVNKYEDSRSFRFRHSRLTLFANCAENSFSPLKLIYYKNNILMVSN